MTNLAKAARALKARHSALLTPEPSFRHPEADRAGAAIDAARARLQGCERAAKDQLALDLRAP